MSVLLEHKTTPTKTWSCVSGQTMILINPKNTSTGFGLMDDGSHLIIISGCCLAPVKDKSDYSSDLLCCSVCKASLGRGQGENHWAPHIQYDDLDPNPGIPRVSWAAWLGYWIGVSKSEIEIFLE